MADLKRRKLIKIEEITADNLKKISPMGLYRLRNIFTQRHVQDFFKLYTVLYGEMKERGLKLLYKAVDRDLEEKEKMKSQLEKLESGNQLMKLQLEKAQAGEEEEWIEADKYETDIEKPFPNEHWARIKNPDNFDQFRRKNDEFGSGIDVIYGKKKGGKMEVQAIRFDKDKFTVAEAKKWLKDNDYKAILFEPASGKEEKKKSETEEVQEQEAEEEINDAMEDDENLSDDLSSFNAKKNVDVLTDVEDLQMEVRFIKVREDRHIVMGVVYEPNKVDSQGDYMKADTIEDMAHNYMLNSQMMKIMHKKKVLAKVIESFIAPVNFKLGNESVKKGAWVMGTKILDTAIWEKIKKGEITGYSIGGRAKVQS